MSKFRPIQKRKYLLMMCIIEDDEFGLPAKRLWRKLHLTEEQRRKQSSYHNLMQELRLNDSEGFRRYVRMDYTSFLELVEMIRPAVQRVDTILRKCVSVEERLAVTLRFLATGESYHSLSGQFRISDSLISETVPEVCSALFNVLRNKHMTVPSSREEWLAVSERFASMWNFPHCVGAIDGKHISIRPPKYSGSKFFNYKGDFSVVLMAIVDADYKFLFVDVGTNGRISDGGVWKKTLMYRYLEENKLDIPPAATVSVNGPRLPYILVGDEAFGLKKYLMRPYSARELDDPKRIFNYRLSRARRVVENAFGILASRWRVLRSPILLDPSKVEHVVLAICALHNYLRDKVSMTTTYTPRGIVDMEDMSTGAICKGSWRADGLGDGMYPLGAPPTNAYAREAKHIRDEFCEYFYTDGQVSWQWSNIAV